MSSSESITSIDLNCDMGELHPIMNTNFDEDIMPHISSCNICCAVHSGSAQLTEKTIRLALLHNVSIGAHPSYPDKINFGRQVMSIPIDELMSHIRYQICAVKGMTESLGGRLNHVKPHGALYNEMHKNPDLAEAIVQLVQSIDPALKLFGLSDSLVQKICHRQGMKYINETFADRAYESKTSLRSRKLDGAILTEKQVMERISDLLNNCLVDYHNVKHSLNADSICLHSDTENAIGLSLKISQHLQSKNVTILSP